MVDPPGVRLRRLWEHGTVPIVGAFNALSARMAERAGFEALYLSGAAITAGVAALPDVGIMGLAEFVQQARYLTAATDLPVLADADIGFGGPLAVERTVREFEAAGVAGIQIEDQQLPKRCGHLSGKQLIEPGEMAAKIAAAVAARRDESFVIVARSDARGVTGFDDAVARAHRYLEAGADAVFPEALESAEEFARFASQLPDATLIANMTEFGRSPLLGVDQLASFGYRGVLYPVTLLRVAMGAVREALDRLRQPGGQAELLAEMLSRQELYDILGYSDYEARDRTYFSR